VFLLRGCESFVLAVYLTVCVGWCALLVAFLWVRCCALVSDASAACGTEMAIRYAGHVRVLLHMYYRSTSYRELLQCTI
jgi:hypothetical protein